VTLFHHLPTHHVVKQGESLRQIAAFYGVEPIHIVEANPHKENRVHCGHAVFLELVADEHLALPSFPDFYP